MHADLYLPVFGSRSLRTKLAEAAGSFEKLPREGRKKKKKRREPLLFVKENFVFLCSPSVIWILLHDRMSRFSPVLWSMHLLHIFGRPQLYGMGIGEYSSCCCLVSPPSFIRHCSYLEKQEGEEKNDVKIAHKKYAKEM